MFVLEQKRTKENKREQKRTKVHTSQSYNLINLFPSVHDAPPVLWGSSFERYVRSRYYWHGLRPLPVLLEEFH